MPKLETIRFSNPKAFSGLTGVIDHENAVIQGVACITGEVDAVGHNLRVDAITLKQLHELSKGKGKLGVTLDHDGGIDDVNGYLDNFRLDGNKLRADWHLLSTHPATPIMLERAERQPETFGLSFAFQGPKEGEMCNGKACARAEDVLSCDVVRRPASNPEGLFSAKGNLTQLDRIEKTLIALSKGEKVDTSKNDMPDTTATQKEPTLADLLAAVQGLTEQVGQIKGVQDQLVQAYNTQAEEGALEGIDPQTLEALYNMSDAELAQLNQERGLNLTRAEIDGAVDSFNASITAQSQEGQGQQNGQTEVASPEGGASAGAAGQGSFAGAGAGAATAAFSALQKELIELKSKINAREAKEKKDAEELQFSAIETNMNALAKQRDEVVALSEKVIAENEALREFARTGVRPVKAGHQSGVRLFEANADGELHEFQKRLDAIKAERKCTDGEAIKFAVAENPALHTDWLQKGHGRAILHS